MEKIISQMRLEDKIALCEGANFGKPRVSPHTGSPLCLSVTAPVVCESRT